MRLLHTQNEYRDEFDAKVKYADEKFKGRARGSLSDRGKTLILFGTPTRIVTAGGSQQSQDQFPDATATRGPSGFHDNEVKGQTWIYDGDAAQKMFGTNHVEITFSDQRSKPIMIAPTADTSMVASWRQSASVNPMRFRNSRWRSVLAPPRRSSPSSTASSCGRCRIRSRIVSRRCGKRTTPRRCRTSGSRR